MKHFKISGLAFALLAGTTLSAPPAMAQDSGETATQPRLLPQQGQETEGTVETERSADTVQEQSSGQAEAEGDPAAEQPTEQTEQSAQEEVPAQERQPGEADTATEAAPDQMQDSEVESATEADPGQEQQDDQTTTEAPSDETTASINITEEQKTEIRDVIVESDVVEVEVDFEVDVGASVPSSIELRPLPPRIVEIVPDYEGYLFFVLADGRIIIIEPDTHEIVSIIVL